MIRRTLIGYATICILAGCSGGNALVSPIELQHAAQATPAASAAATAVPGTPSNPSAASIPTIIDSNAQGYGPRVPVGRQASLGCPGNAVMIAPGTSIQSVVNANSAGSTYCLEPGTFAQQQIVPKSGDTYIGLGGGAVLDGQGKAAHAFHGNATGVTIENLLIENYSTIPQDAPVDPGYSGGTNWTLLNNEVANNSAAGIDGASGDHYVANYLHNNGEEGYKANGTGEVWTDNVIAYNYPVFNSKFSNIGELGGGKAWTTKNLTISYNYVHDNGGPGIWNDHDNQGTVITYNDVENNVIGILHEISWDAVITNNYLTNNTNSVNSCTIRSFSCAEININNSGGVNGKSIVISNNLVGPNNYGAGIILLNRSRGSGLYGPYLVQNVAVSNNTIRLGGTSSMGGIDIDHSDPAMFSTRGNSFNYDDYAGGPGLFHWSEDLSASGDFHYFQSLGQELNATATSMTQQDRPKKHNRLGVT